MIIQALTNSNNKIVNTIITPVEIKNIFTGSVVRTKAIWDTGATSSVVTKDIAEKIGLESTGFANVMGVHGVKKVNVYFANVTLNNKEISINRQMTECEQLSGDKSVGMLIGMDIITLGDFSVSNHDGKTFMTFRVPSLEHIDYVKEINDNNKIKLEHQAWMRQGNKKCPCGSGRTYDNCHGKSIYF